MSNQNEQFEISLSDAIFFKSNTNWFGSDVLADESYWVISNGYLKQSSREDAQAAPKYTAFALNKEELFEALLSEGVYVTSTEALPIVHRLASLDILRSE